MPKIEEAELTRVATAIMHQAGMNPEDARILGESLVYANLCGVESHGVLRLKQYAENIGLGNINPRPNVQVLQRRGATALIDGDGGYGYRPSFEAMKVAVELAQSSGIGIVGVRNSRHFGMAANYTSYAAKAGMIGWITTTSSPLLPPTGGATAVIGNNPISMSAPRRPPLPPIVLDISLSQVANGKIRLAAAEGRSIPLGWALDSKGQPTTDAQEALRSRLLMPVGGHKGYGLSVMMEVLAGVLTGSPFGLKSGAHDKSGGVGHLAMAINPAFFIDPEQFYDGVEELVDQIKSVSPVDGADGIYLPGEIEWKRLQERRKLGIQLSDGVAGQIGVLAESLGVEAPQWL